MKKIFNLGSVFEFTGEVRVKLLDNDLIKSASNEIQDYWSKLMPNEQYAYLHVIAVAAGEYYGCNNNGDWFSKADLKKYGNTFYNANVFLHHQNRDPKNGVGAPIYVFYNDNMHRIELILRIDKSNSKAYGLMRDIKNNVQIFVSMGTNQAYDICSICGHKSMTRKEYCDHLRYNMGRILDDGRLVCAHNPNPSFFDISVVSRPAGKNCWALDKMASELKGVRVAISSAELGEHFMDAQQKLASLKKFSEIIKKIDGDATELKDTDGSFKLLRGLKDSTVKDMDYPTIGCSDMDEFKLSPGGMLRIFCMLKIPPSLSEIAAISGRHFMGSQFNDSLTPSVLSMLPSFLQFMQRDPDRITDLVSSMASDYGGELDDEHNLKSILSGIAPRISGRIIIIKQACNRASLDKVASEILQALPQQGEKSPIKARIFEISGTGPGLLETFTVNDTAGNKYVTNRMSAQEAANGSFVRKLVGTVFGVGALGAAMSDTGLIGRLVVPAVLGGLAWKLLAEPKQTIVSEEGVEVPVRSLFKKVEEGYRKEASVWGAAKELGKYFGDNVLKKENAGVLGGMAIPAAMGLDYVISRYKNRKNPYWMPGPVDNAGESVINHPFKTMIGAGIAGETMRQLFKKHVLKTI